MRLSQSYKLGHWIGANSKGLDWRAIVQIAVTSIETPSCFGACEGASFVASFRGSSLKGHEQRSADAAKPRVWRDVVKSNVTSVRDGANCENIRAVDGKEQGIIRLPDPGFEGLVGLVAQPSLQDFAIVVMVGNAQLCYRPPHYFASGWCIFQTGGTNFHFFIMPSIPIGDNIAIRDIIGIGVVDDAVDQQFGIRPIRRNRYPDLDRTTVLFKRTGDRWRRVLNSLTYTVATMCGTCIMDGYSFDHHRAVKSPKCLNSFHGSYVEFGAPKREPVTDSAARTPAVRIP
jgi:hypothetical protein